MPALPFRQTLAAGLLVVAPLILPIALPGALSAQTIMTVSPQQCVWRAGDDPAWAAPNLDETGWQPCAQFALRPDQPHIWIRCRLDPAAFRTLDHPAVQIRALAAYEVFLNGVSIAHNGNLENGNFAMNSIRVFPVRCRPGRTRKYWLFASCSDMPLSRPRLRFVSATSKLSRTTGQVICSASCPRSFSKICPL